MNSMTSWRSQAGRFLALVLLSAFSLQLFFAAKIVLMRWVDPQSTAFQRSEIWRLAWRGQSWTWRQTWRDYGRIGLPIKRAVIAAEDAGFADHSGIEWDAVEQAWERNLRAQQQADVVNDRVTQWAQTAGKPIAPNQWMKPQIVGGSTITQQLAKNLFMSSERSFMRKGQEAVITLMLEACLSKQRILEIYLNNVEWGEGLFGIQAAARAYYRTDADRLAPQAAARLAVMLPAPKRFETRPGSPYIQGRAGVILSRMGRVDVP